MSQQQWDQEYQAGHWNYLQNLTEFAHYMMIAGYIKNFVNLGRVLDAGCGVGILERYLYPDSVKEYIGIEWSQNAIDKSISTERATYICSSIEAYQSPQREYFDAIVFNESLYCLADPISTLQRYYTFLKRKGILILSMYENELSKNVNHHIEKLSEWKRIDQTKVTNRENLIWNVSLFIKNFD